MGAGLLFCGPAEPIDHFSVEPGLEGGTAEAVRVNMVLIDLHGGLHASSV